MKRPNDHFPLLKIAVALLLGVVAGYYINYPKVPFFIFSPLIITSLLTCFQHRNPIRQSVFLLLSVFCLGFALMEKQKLSTHNSFPSTPITYHATLLSEPTERGKIIQFDVTTRINNQPIKAKVSLLKDTIHHRYKQLHIGSGICAHTLLQTPERAASSFAYLPRWLRVNGYNAQTFIPYNRWVAESPQIEHINRFERALLSMKIFREKCIKYLNDLGLSKENEAIVMAMSLGEKRFLSKTQKEDYSVAGASHILALSGLHIGILFTVFMAFFKLFRRFAYFRSIERYGIISSLIVFSMWGYVFLVGFMPSVVRSTLMITIYMLTALLRRNSLSINSLSFALCVIILFNPLALFDIGLQFSFLAVFSILTFSPIIESYLQTRLFHKQTWWKWTSGVVAVSLAAHIATAPLVAYYFHRLPNYFLLTNLIVVPCATLLLYLVLLLFLFSPWNTAQRFLVDILESLTAFLNDFVATISRLPYASVNDIQLSLPQVIAIYIAIFSLLIVLRYFRRSPDME